MPHLLKEVVTTSAHFHLMHHSVPLKDAATVVHITVRKHILMMLVLMHSIFWSGFVSHFCIFLAACVGEKHIT